MHAIENRHRQLGAGMLQPFQFNIQPLLRITLLKYILRRPMVGLETGVCKGAGEIQLILHGSEGLRGLCPSTWKYIHFVQAVFMKGHLF